MIDHVSIAVSDLAAAAKFYELTLAPLGYAMLEERAATVGFGKRYAEFWINLRDVPAGRRPARMSRCGRRAWPRSTPFTPQPWPQAATCDCPPGLRPQHGEKNYYAAFIRDRDGNRISAVTFPGAAGHRSM